MDFHSRYSPCESSPPPPFAPVPRMGQENQKCQHLSLPCFGNQQPWHSDSFYFALLLFCSLFFYLLQFCQQSCSVIIIAVLLRIIILFFLQIQKSIVNWRFIQGSQPQIGYLHLQYKPLHLWEGHQHLGWQLGSDQVWASLMKTTMTMMMMWYALENQD